MTTGASWAVVNEAGDLVGEYARAQSAELNSAGGIVVPGPPQGSNRKAIRWEGDPETGGWVERETELDPMAAVRETWDRRRHRQVGYAAAIESGEQFEVLTDFMMWFRNEPAAASMPSALKDRIDALVGKIAAVKAANP